MEIRRTTSEWLRDRTIELLCRQTPAHGREDAAGRAGEDGFERVVLLQVGAIVDKKTELPVYF